MLDLLIRGGIIVDGTGTPGRRGDVGVRDGRIVAVGSVSEEASEVIDATGRVVAPGFVDPHTHYDAQILWDPYATPSNLHGVTTMIAGNCGFTLAPLHAHDADYLRAMMAKVEGMPLAALETGVDWNWTTFGEYLDRVEGATALNIGFLVGHCALRRHVMGPDAVGREATDDEIAAMEALLGEAIEAGGLGFSTTLSFTHSDGDGQPVASRWASKEEVLRLAGTVGEHEGTTLEYVTDGCLKGFTDAEVEMMGDISLAGRRPLNWNVLTIDSAEPERYEEQLGAVSNANQRGAKVVALSMPVLVEMNMSFSTYCALFMLPGWSDVMGLPIPERIDALRDPAVRQRLNEGSHSPEAGVIGRLSRWSKYMIGDTYSTANDGLKGQIVGDIAERENRGSFDVLCDIVINDDLRTVLWPIPPDDDIKSWQLRAQAWNDDRVLVGGSDAGAHLDRMNGAPYTTAFLADCLRGRQLIPMEQAVHLMTQAPAELFGLAERGRVVEGFHADLVVFDPETVGAEAASLVNDLPGGASRLYSPAIGVDRVIVSGRVIVADGVATGERPGKVLRSGTDTVTVPIPADG